jgi:hypothetical protein
MTGVIEQKGLLEVICLLSGQDLLGPMGRQLLLNGPEYGLVDDRRLLPGQGLTSVPDLANREAVRGGAPTLAAAGWTEAAACCQKRSDDRGRH